MVLTFLRQLRNWKLVAHLILSRIEMELTKEKPHHGGWWGLRSDHFVVKLLDFFGANLSGY